MLVGIRHRQTGGQLPIFEPIRPHDSCDPNRQAESSSRIGNPPGVLEIDVPGVTAPPVVETVEI